MDIPTELPGILSWFGLPASALVLAYGLVKGADYLEADAKEERLKYISDLLKERSLTSLGRLGAAVIPLIFEKVFGSNPLSIRFISRSILASILFWAVLMIARHADISAIFSDSLTSVPKLIVAPIALLMDWVSLVKSKLILNIMPRRAVFFGPLVS